MIVGVYWGSKFLALFFYPNNPCCFGASFFFFSFCSAKSFIGLMSSVRNGKRVSSLSSHSTMMVFAWSFALSSLLDGLSPTMRKSVLCVRFSTSTQPCFARISPITFLGISNVPVIQNDFPDSFPSIVFFLKSKSEKLMPDSTSLSRIVLLS